MAWEQLPKLAVFSNVLEATQGCRGVGWGWGGGEREGGSKTWAIRLYDNMLMCSVVEMTCGYTHIRSVVMNPHWCSLSESGGMKSGGMTAPS